MAVHSNLSGSPVLARGWRAILGAAALVLLTGALQSSSEDLQLGPPPVSLQAGCKGRCLNPHPGRYQESTGPRDARGWVQVWHRWPDGCVQYQWKKSDGSLEPVTWTCCVH